MKLINEVKEKWRTEEKRCQGENQNVLSEREQELTDEIEELRNAVESLSNKNKALRKKVRGQNREMDNCLDKYMAVLEELEKFKEARQLIYTRGRRI